MGGRCVALHQPIYISSNNLCSSLLFNSSSPSVFAAAQDAASMVFDDQLDSPISPGPNFAKRTMSDEDNTASKRLRLSDTAPATSSSSTSRNQGIRQPVASTSRNQGIRQPAASAGISARIDSSAAQQYTERFNIEVKHPILNALALLKDRCIVCLISEDNEWETHKTDRCQRRYMHFPKDATFVAFKQSFRFFSGFCYGCGLDPVSSAAY